MNHEQRNAPARPVPTSFVAFLSTRWHVPPEAAASAFADWIASYEPGERAREMARLQHLAPEAVSAASADTETED